MDPTLIPALHRAYVALTGLDVALNAVRERAWFEWLRYRQDDPFTAEDLKLVVEHLRRGIRDEQRNPGCLRFRNLIEQPDDFDEERALARKARALAARPRPPAEVDQTSPDAHGTTTRRVPNPGTADASRTVGAVVQGASVDELIRQMKEAAK